MRAGHTIQNASRNRPRIGRLLPSSRPDWGRCREDDSCSEMRPMGLPKPPEARLYYRAAKQRFDDAQWLLEGERTTGAIYLAGYTVECFLKALLLASVASHRRKMLLEEFRGSRAHNLEWLGALFRQ